MRISLFNLPALALAAMAAPPAFAMGGPTPPPESVRVERAAPARPAATQAATDAPAASLPRDELDIQAAAEVSPKSLLFERRPVVVFADSAQEPAFLTQMQLLARDPAAMARRDVIVIIDTDPAANSAWRQMLRPRGFALIILDTDGTVIDRKPAPWDTREIGRAIDKTPVRREETRARGEQDYKEIW